jgi:hypothetical protein
MDAILSETALPQHTANWDAIFAEVNAWRGACVHHFSAVEMAVTETLLSLSEVAPSGASVRLRHLIGQRLQDITAATGPGGSFSEAGKAAQIELLHYREKHETFRNQLCHGFTRISVERNGHWVVVMRAIAINARKPERTTLVLDQGEAMAKLDALKRDGSKLSSVLGNLRRTVAAEP